MSQYVLMSLSMLNMPENARINCSDYAKVLNMPGYNNNNIMIIVTNVIMFEFLSSRLLL